MDPLVPFIAGIAIGLVAATAFWRWRYHRQSPKLQDARAMLQEAAELLNGARKALR